MHSTTIVPSFAGFPAFVGAIKSDAAIKSLERPAWGQRYYNKAKQQAIRPFILKVNSLYEEVSTYHYACTP